MPGKHTRAEMYLEFCRTSNMERFGKILNMPMHNVFPYHEYR